MTIKKSSFLLTALLIPVLFVHAQDYEICHWLNDRSSATIMTFDDYSPAHWEIGIPALEREALPGTFFVTISNIWHSGHYQIMNDAISNGIEIGFHTDTHPNLTQLNNEQLQTELVDSKISFDSNLTNPTLTMAYPFGSFNNTVIEKTKEEHIAARTVFQPSGGDWEYEFASTENDYFKIPTKAVNSSLSLQAYKNEVISGMNTGGMVVFMYHSIYNDQGDGDTWFDAIHEDDFQDQLDYLQTVKEQTWVTTFSNAVRYHKEQHCATLSTIENTSSHLTMSLTDTLSNDIIYNQPLTIKLNVGPLERYTSITQNGDEVTYTLSDNENYYLINLIPDGGDIILAKDQTLAIEPATSNDSRFQAFPIPSTSTITIKSKIVIDNIRIVDNQGREVSGVTRLGKHTMSIESLSDGLYFALISSVDGVYSVPFIKN